MRSPRLANVMNAPYMVHSVDTRRYRDGLFAPDETLLATAETRAAACGAATTLIRNGASSVEVRLRCRLLDSFVRRGSSPRHIYSAPQRRSGELPL